MKILGKKKQKSLPYEDRSDIKQPTQLEQLKLNEIQKALCLKVSRDNFISLIKVAVDNLNNDKNKTTVDGNKYDLKNAKTFLLEIINRKITENEASKLFNDLIKPDIDVLMNSTSKGKDKRNNILNILSNVELLVFDGLYFDYHDKPGSKFLQKVLVLQKEQN